MDLTSLFTAYVETLRDAKAPQTPIDSTTVVALAQPEVRTEDVTDLNTAYALRLT